MKPAQPVRPSLDAVRLALPLGLSVVGFAVGVPLFLRSPLWCDITLYDMAAKNLLGGGVHYRDLFDTNTPGFVWLLAGIRSLVGWGSESLRAIDLLIFGGIVLTLWRFGTLGGAGKLHRLWLLAGCVGFYPFAHEMAHAQRDVWLTLPALLAVLGRLKRITRPVHGLARGLFLPAFGEGVLWAVAVWIKPHFLLLALCGWVVTAPRLVGSRGRWWFRVLIVDLGGNLLAGGLIGGAGVGYLVASGTWEAFSEVMSVWNVGYLNNVLSEIHARWAVFVWFPPWNFLAPLTVGLALIGLIDARPWSPRFRPAEQGGLLHPIAFRQLWHTGGTDEQRYIRGCLGAVYILWVLQGIVLQRPYNYVHAAEVMIGLAVWAAFRWNAAAVVWSWLVLVQMMWVFNPQGMKGWAERSYNAREVFTPHPLFDRQRVMRWADCFRPMAAEERYRLTDDLRREVRHPAAAGWEELHQTAEYLRGRRVGARELVCWHDSPHVLYLMLDVKPGLRFMHVNTARLISPECDRRVCDEFAANPHKRFVVIDLQRPAYIEWVLEYQRAGGGDHRRVFEAYKQPGPTADDLLPPAAGWIRSPRMLVPDEPPLPFDTAGTVFRSGGGRGRYVVIELKE